MTEIEATNFQYVDPLDEKEVKKIFLSTANSYYTKEIVKKIQSINKDENAKIFYEISATFDEIHLELLDVKKLSVKDEAFVSQVTQCDVIVCDISRNKNQLEEAQIILKYLEEKLENGAEFDLTLILISSIMTWARTPRNPDEVTTDRHYRKRRPHPCFNQHLLVERRFLNLEKKYKNSIKSFVVCPGIIYGEEEDIFHYIFKSCYLNSPQIDIFFPGSNKLPIIYIHDFVKFLIQIISSPKDENANYLLAVQPNPLSVKRIVESLITSMGGDEMRVKICEKEEIFLMNEDMMTQRVFDHLTLDLNIQSELANFEFEITGLNFEEKVPKIIQEYYNSRELRPIKMLIDGSPFAYQNELAKIFSDFYHIHHVRNKCFLKNFMARLKKKIDGALNYQAKMGDIAFKLYEHVDCQKMMLKAQNDINSWNEKIQEIQNILGESEEAFFEEKKHFIKERLSSHACSKNQGYVMNGFELNVEKASYLFLDESGEFNNLKPDFVIILNRTMDIASECLEIEGFDENEKDELKVKQWKLKYYYDTQFEDICLYNFFTDRNVPVMEISIDHDFNQLELIQLFESLKTKIGEPCTYELSDTEKLEIEKIKSEIAEKEKLEREAEEKEKIEREREEKEKQIEEWTQQAIEQKKRDLEDIERRSLPVRHYLMNYVLPKLSNSLIELTKVRPSNPAEFLAYHLTQQQQIDIDDENLDDEVVREFKRLVNASKCD